MVNGDINDPGKPKTLQRVCYLVARAETTEEWEDLSNMLGHMLADKLLDGAPLLIANSLAVAAEEVCRCRNLAIAVLHRRERP